MSDVEAIHVEWELLDPEGDAEACLPPLHIGLLSNADVLASQMSGVAHITPAWLVRAEEQMPAKVDGASQTSAATQAASEARESPVGTRRRWHNRIVEKLKDGTWHVVGHVAGLEDPKVVDPIQPAHMDKDELIQLISTILHHMYESGEHKPASESPSAAGRGESKEKSMKAEDAFKAAADMLQRASDVLKAAGGNPFAEKRAEAEEEEKGCTPAEKPDAVAKSNMPVPVLGQLAGQSAGGSMVPGVDAPKAGEFAAAGISIAGMGLDPGVDAPLPPEIGLGMDGGSVYIPEGVTW